jgi:chromosome segregation ATPase
MLRKIDIARSWQHARAQFAALVAEHDALKRELAETKRERDEFRAAMRELQAAILARQQAEAELAGLYRERAIARARAAERDPAQPLQ